MRSVLGILGIYLLTLMLAGSFPLGAGDAMHGGALLHPAFPHTHDPSGGTGSAATAAPFHEPKVGMGPSLDSSAGGATEIPTVGLTPPVPRPALGEFLLGDERVLPRERPRPIGRLEPPPDPPPPTASVSA